MGVQAAEHGIVSVLNANMQTTNECVCSFCK